MCDVFTTDQAIAKLEGKTHPPAVAKSYFKEPVRADSENISCHGRPFQPCLNLNKT